MGDPTQPGPSEAAQPETSAGANRRNPRLGKIAVLLGVGVAAIGVAAYLAAAGSLRLLHTLDGHTIAVRGLAFTPDGGTLVSCGQDGSIRLWNAADGREIATMRGQEGGILGMDLAPDGKTLVTGGTDHAARLWDLSSRQMRDTLKHDTWVRAVAFSPDGRTIATGSAQDPSEDKEKAVIHLWAAPSGKEGSTLRGHGMGDIMALRFTADGGRLLSASTDRSGGVGWWEVRAGKLIDRIPAHAGEILALALSPDGKLLASAGTDRTIQLWDVDSHRVVTSLPGQSISITSLSFSRDGRTLASGDVDGRVKFWDLATGQETDTFRAHDGWVGAIAYSPDGVTLATGKGNSTLVTGTEPPAAEVKLWALPSDKVGTPR